MGQKPCLLLFSELTYVTHGIHLEGCVAHSPNSTTGYECSLLISVLIPVVKPCPSSTSLCTPASSCAPPHGSSASPHLPTAGLSRVQPHPLLSSPPTVPPWVPHKATSFLGVDAHPQCPQCPQCPLAWAFDHLWAPLHPLLHPLVISLFGAYLPPSIICLAQKELDSMHAFIPRTRCDLMQSGNPINVV